MTDQSDIQRQRDELRTALNDLEDRVNPAKVAGRVKEKASASLRDDPAPWIAAAAGVVVLIAGAVTLAIFGRR